jgi:transcriptional regulator with XRE-family HTH domain
MGLMGRPAKDLVAAKELLEEVPRYKRSEKFKPTKNLTYAQADYVIRAFYRGAGWLPKLINGPNLSIPRTHYPADEYRALPRGFSPERDPEWQPIPFGSLISPDASAFLALRGATTRTATFHEWVEGRVAVPKRTEGDWWVSEGRWRYAENRWECPGTAWINKKELARTLLNASLRVGDPYHPNPSEDRPLVTKSMSLDIRRAGSDYKFVLGLVDLIDWLRGRFPDQVRGPVASFTRAQWLMFDEIVRPDVVGQSEDSRTRYYERWKKKLRGMGRGMVWEGAPALPDMEPTHTFSLDVAAVAAAEASTLEHRNRLQEAVGRRRGLEVSRTQTAQQIAEDLGTTAQTIGRWAVAGMPHRRRGKGAGKGRPRLFDLDEVIRWVRRRGTGKQRWIVAVATVTPEEIGEAIATSRGFAEAAAKLGLSPYQFRQLRKLRKVHVPTHARDRAPVESIVSREDLLRVAKPVHGDRAAMAEELGVYIHELRHLISHYGLKDHPIFTRLFRPNFTRDQLLAAIEKHHGMREAIAEELGVSPRRDPGADARSRGHVQLTEREATLVPFWIAALREVRSRYPERGGNRKTAAAIGISAVSVSNILQGKRVPGYDVMLKILAAAGWPEPPWREALQELIDSHKTPLEHARGIALSTATAVLVEKEIGARKPTVQGYLHGKGASMTTMQKILEATGRPYLVESAAGMAAPKRASIGELPAGMVDNPYTAAIASLLPLYRSQTALGKDIGVSVHTFGHWLHGESPPRPSGATVAKLRRALVRHGLPIPAEIETRFQSMEPRLAELLLGYSTQAALARKLGMTMSRFTVVLDQRKKPTAAQSKKITKLLRAARRAARKAARKNPPLCARIGMLRARLAGAANEAIAEFEWSGGGACDVVADALASVLAGAGIDTLEGGHDGDDHAWLIAYDGAAREACGVDVPASIYERGGGYSWQRLEGTTVVPSDVALWPISFEDIQERVHG